MGVYRSQVVITGPAVTGNGTNTWHFRTTDDLNPARDIQTGLAGAALLTFYTAIGTSLSDTASWSHDGEWTRIDEVGAGASSDPWTFDGGTGGEPLPSATALVVGWRTATPGRSRRGRTFLGPMGLTTAQDNGTPQEDDRASVLTAALALQDAFSDPGDGAFVVWSPFLQEAFDFTDARVANRFAVLRSRRD